MVVITGTISVHDLISAYAEKMQKKVVYITYARGGDHSPDCEFLVSHRLIAADSYEEMINDSHGWFNFISDKQYGHTRIEQNQVVFCLENEIGYNMIQFATSDDHQQFYDAYNASIN